MMSKTVLDWDLGSNLFRLKLALLGIPNNILIAIPELVIQIAWD